MTTLAEVRAFLMFWGPLPDPARTGDDKKQWKADLHRRLELLDDATVDALSAHLQARYDGIETTRGSISARATALLLFVGVLTTGASLVAQSLVGEPWPLVAVAALVGLALLYTTVAVAVLAVRAQLVTQWDSPWVGLADATSERAVRVLYATEILVAVEQNKVRVRRPVAFLRDAQRYAILAIVCIAALAVTTVVAADFKSPAGAAASAAAPPPAVTRTSPSPSVGP